MTDKHDIIKNAYISFGFPGGSRLYTLLSKDHKEITKEDIKNVLGNQSDIYNQIFELEAIELHKLGQIIKANDGKY